MPTDCPRTDLRRSRTRAVGRGRWLLVALTVAGLSLLPPPALAAARYTVVAGDSLWSIAREHGCTVDQLRRANDLDEGPLLVGARLTVPRCSAGSSAKATTTAREHVVQRGDTLSGVAVRYHTTVSRLRELNELPGDVIVPGQRLAVGAASTTTTIRVVPGQSRGRPQRGTLVDGAKLPYSPQYYRRRPEWVYGAQHVIDHVRRAIASVNHQHPTVHRLAIGDISAPGGGVLPGHGSHQSGRDVDLGLYYRAVPADYPQQFVRAKDAKLDAAATWALVRALVDAAKTSTGPEKIFLDYGVQGQLYEAARKAGYSRAKLKKIFQYPDGRWARERLVQHEPKHDDHLHVRFKCPPRDATCK